MMGSESPLPTLRCCCSSIRITAGCASKSPRPKSLSPATRCFQAAAQKQKRGVTFITPRQFSIRKFLPRKRTLKGWLPRSRERRAWAPQRVALRMTMRVRQRMPIRMAGTHMPVAVAIPRRGLRQPRRITDRAEIRRQRSNVVADRLQPLQYGLPLFPIQLTQERPQSLDERILQQSFAVGFRNEEAIQPYVQGCGDLLQGAEARRHLAALDARQIRARHL